MSSVLSQRPRATPRFELRPFKRRDVASIHAAVLVSLDELAKWLPWASETYSRAITQQFVRDSIAAWNEARAYDFSIRAPSDAGRHYGNVSVWWTSRPNLVGEIGYWVRTDESNKGICTEAVARLLDVAFDELGMHRVTLRIAVGNRGSERVAEKLGFTHEGLLRDEVKVGREWLDHTLWALLESEWRAERGRYRAQAWI